MSVFDPVIKALTSPGPQTDHSTHTTRVLPGHPVDHGAIHTNQKAPDTGDFDALRRAKGGPKPY